MGNGGGVEEETAAEAAVDALLRGKKETGFLGGILRKQCVQRCNRGGIAEEECNQLTS